MAGCGAVPANRRCTTVEVLSPCSVLNAHPKDPQLFRKRIPALSGLCSSFDGRLNGLGALFFSRFDQPEFMSSVCFGPLEGGDEFGMGMGWIHEDLIV